MSATILKFPVKNTLQKQTTLRLPLYTDGEIEAVLVCMNALGVDDMRHTFSSLVTLDPHLVIRNLNVALESIIFSEEFKKTVKNILDNIEIVEVK